MKRSHSVQVLTNESGWSSKISLPVPPDEFNLHERLEKEGLCAQLPLLWVQDMSSTTPPSSHPLPLLLLQFKGLSEASAGAG